MYFHRRDMQIEEDIGAEKDSGGTAEPERWLEQRANDEAASSQTMGEVILMGRWVTTSNPRARWVISGWECRVLIPKSDRRTPASTASDAAERAKGQP